jgi:hypothetical protein
MSKLTSLQRKQITALRAGKWLTLAESGQACGFPIGKAGVECLRCGETPKSHIKARASPLRKR